MKSREKISFTLLLAYLLVMVVAYIPHHHHSNSICLSCNTENTRYDYCQEPECTSCKPENNSNEDNKNHCKDSTCISKHSHLVKKCFFSKFLKEKTTSLTAYISTALIPEYLNPILPSVELLYGNFSQTIIAEYYWNANQLRAPPILL